ncbi:MAG: DNA/RNA non-specific endonuclease [Bacteroidaceae bacterium]|nr:DNA/RNA non-specific endonuclease [Bacteroidaceae bacterium]
MARKKKTKFPYWLTVLIAVILWIGGDQLKLWLGMETDQQKIERSVQEADMSGLEIPTINNGKQGQILQRTGYTLSYDSKNKTPQWVAWELTKEETRGKEERSTEFYPDPDVIGAQVVTYDYSHSGYDRGHMAPAGDMKWSKQAMQESFYMSNICPQDHNLNTEDWNDLEMKTREWARQYGKVYVVCGPIYTGKRNEYIGEHRVKVPDAFFKVILINNSKKQCALGFLFENKAGENPLEKYLVPVDQIEKTTGLDFFSALPDELENQLEAELPEKLP